MAFPDDQVLWLLNNKPKVLRYIHGLQVVVGLALMVLGLHMGHAHQEQFPRRTVRLSDRPATCLRLGPLCVRALSPNRPDAIQWKINLWMQISAFARGITLWLKNFHRW